MDREGTDIASWIDRELAGSKFSDERLGKRLRKLLVQLDAGMGESLPFACRDWASTKAAYRFLSNDEVSEREILAGPVSNFVREAIRWSGKDHRYGDRQGSFGSVAGRA